MSAETRVSTRLGLHPRVADAVAVTVVFSVLLFYFATLLHFRYGRDQGIFQVVAGVMLDGGAPYLDAWDFKPPGIYFVYVLARLFGTGETAIRVFEVICLISVLLATSILTRRHLGSVLAGLFGGTLAVITHVQLEYWHTAQPETFAAVALVWALLCVTWEPRAGDPAAPLKQAAAWSSAGTLFGIAFLMKPHLGGGILFSWALVVRPWPRERSALGAFLRRGVRPTLALFGGFAMPVVLTLLYYLHHEAVGSLYRTLFVFAPQYAGLDFEWDELPVYFYTAIRDVLIGFSGVTLLGVALALGLPAVRRSERTVLLHLAGALVFPTIGVALQAKFFLYHYDTAVMLGQLIAGIGIYKGWRLARRNLVVAAVFLLLVAFLVDLRITTRLGGSQFSARNALRREWLWSDRERRQEINDRLYAGADFSTGANREVALWLTANTPADRPVFIWGFEPTVYLESNRRLASRYLYNLPQRVPWGMEEHRPILLRDLERRTPAAIVVERKDRMPWVVGNEMDSADALTTFPELHALIERNYELTAYSDRFLVYMHKSSSQ